MVSAMEMDGFSIPICCIEVEFILGLGGIYLDIYYLNELPQKIPFFHDR